MIPARRLIPLAYLAAMHLAPISYLSAQVVTGRIVDATSGQPVGTGFVVLLDQEQREVARALSTSDGQFTLRAPRAGTYRLRSERIGYRASESEQIELVAGTTLTYSLTVQAIPIILSTVEVVAEDRCQVSPDRATETGLLWEEIRKALAATAWDGTQELARYRTYSYQRELSTNRRQIVWERGRTAEGVARQPYISRPAALLAAQGYIVRRGDSTTYNLPDPGVLLDDTFLDSHCFHVVRDARDKPGQIGLAFEPLAVRDISDVRGVLWLDENTSQLRTLDVSFTRLPDDLDDDRVGGTAEFMMLPSGAWIIQRWEVRTPVAQIGRPVNPFDRGPRRVAVIRAFRDAGGQVLEVTTSDGIKTYPPGLAHVGGTIRDSTKQAPLERVRLGLGGTDLWAETDAQGVFHLTAPLEGRYTVILSHPWLDSIAYFADQQVELAKDRTTTLSIVIPHVRSSLARMCPGIAGRPGFGAVIGAVTEEGGGPGNGAEVTATWQIVETQGGRLTPRDVRAVVKTDDAGHYVLCGVPLRHPLTLSAQRGRTVSRTASLVLPAADRGDVLLTWDRGPGDEYSKFAGVARPLWTLDLRLMSDAYTPPRAGARGGLSGIVTDQISGDAVGGVLVKVNTGDSTVTRPDGTFDLPQTDWQEGANFIAMRRMGYAPWVQEIWLSGSDARLDLSVALRPQAVAMEAVDVTATLMEEYLTDVGYYQRENSERGEFLHHRDIEDRLGRATYVVELLTGIAGVMVVEAKPGVAGGPSLSFRGMQSMYGCTAPRIYLDGFLTDVEDLDVSVRPQDIYALEVYRTPSQIPPRYSGPESGCGVLLIWTRRGR